LTTAVETGSVRFEEAIGFLRNKLDLPTEAWTDLWEAMHSVAFVVAGANTEALVSDFHQVVNQAIGSGTTLQAFRKEFDRIVLEHGWQYRGSAGWRSRVIFETNLRMAYAAGRWAQIQRLKHVRPYLRYVTVDDERVRPEHRAWHNIVLPVDDPWWQTHFPPCGWGCRCRVTSLSERDLKRYGLKLSPQAPEVRYVAKPVRTPDGPVLVETPVGIDPGFGYNPGAGAFGHGSARLALEKHGSWKALIAPGERTRTLDDLPIDTTVTPPGPAGRPSDAESFRAAFRQALGGADELTIADPLGAGIRLGMAIVDHMLDTLQRQDGRERYFPLLPELIRNPAEIWIGFAEDEGSGKVSMRRRYIRLFDIGRGTTVGIVADADGREWSGITFFRDAKTGTNTLRQGLRVFRRP
jgi:SPP1 gp7 family putative phage head morphogenesis protein